MKNPKLKPMPTHEAVVEKHLKTKGSITSIQAFKKYNFTRLAAHICQLRKKKKMKIESEWITRNGSSFVKYKLVA